MKCPKCEAYNDYESVYCYKCGEKLKLKEKQTHHFKYLCFIIFALLNIGFILVYSIMEILYINPIITRINQKRNYLKDIMLKTYKLIATTIINAIKNILSFIRL
jgi:predicted nucleic acid-binding Zn ribbon protein